MRPPYQEPSPDLGGTPGDLAEAAREAMEGVTFGAKGDERFLIDPVPRVITGEEWEPLAAGLAQRVRALDRWCADAYGERRIVRDGVLPERVLDTIDAYEPALQGLELPLWVGIAGLDVVRDPDGAFLVLEDNLRTPSGPAYAVAARSTSIKLHKPEVAPRALDALPELLRGTLAATAPWTDEPRMVVLTDGPENPAYWEHAWLAGSIGVPLVHLDELDLDAVDVVYRRTNGDRLQDPTGERLRERWMAGRLGIVNAFGVGVGDDKLVHAYVEDMVRYYLGEEPLVRSVRTYDLCVDSVREEALDRFEELVIKPRGGYGGEGVVICPHAEPADVRALRNEVTERPSDFIAQEMIPLSHHPTVIDGELRQRHVDLRPFVFLRGGDQADVLPGGLTRVAFDDGALVVNSSQNGGAKDTWVVD